MNIALVCPDDLSIVLFCKGIIKELKSVKDSEVYVICSAGDYRQELTNLGVHVQDVDIDRYTSFSKDLIYLFGLYRVFRSKRFDLVLTFSTKANIYGTIAAAMAGARKIAIHVVGLGGVFTLPPGFKTKLKQFVFLLLYRVSCFLSDRVWFTNPNDMSFFIRKKIVSTQKTILTRNYLDTDFYSPSMVSDRVIADLKRELGIGENDKTVMMVARMIWSKGIREYAEAAELISSKRTDVTFVLVAPLEPGNPDFVPESYIREMEKKARLKWLGFRNDIRELYAVSDLAVAPTYYKEGGYPRSLLEPMSMGKPLISADSIDCKSAVEEGQNGYLVPIRDSKALAKSIEDLIDNPEKMKRFGSYSRLKAKEKFDERKIVQYAVARLV